MGIDKDIFFPVGGLHFKKQKLMYILCAEIYSFSLSGSLCLIVSTTYAQFCLYVYQFSSVAMLRVFIHSWFHDYFSKKNKKWNDVFGVASQPPSWNFSSPHTYQISSFANKQTTKELYTIDTKEQACHTT